MSLRGSTWKKALIVWGILLLLLIFVLLFSPTVGAERINVFRALGFGVDPNEWNPDRQILFAARLPRILFGLVAGASLALAGAVYQALLHNDLAEPYTLGVSGGAAFGALLAIHLVPAALLAWFLPLVTFFFAVCAVTFIYQLARLRGPSTSPAKLLLAGVTLNLLFGAGILLIQYLSDPYQTFSMIRWMMGGVDVGSFRVVMFCGAVMLVGLSILVMKARTLNVLSLGEVTAAHLGVEVESNRRLLLIVSSFMAASVVAYAGPIGFIGLIVPHALRLIVGADHRILIPATALAGGAFLVMCDTVGRTLIPFLYSGARQLELPVGIITAFLGAPFFFWLLFRRTSG